MTENKKYDIVEAVTVWAHDAAYGAVLQMFPWKGDEAKLEEWSKFASEVAISAVESDMVSDAIKEHRFGRAIRYSSGIAVAAGFQMLEEVAEAADKDPSPFEQFNEYIKVQNAWKRGGEDD